MGAFFAHAIQCAELGQAQGVELRQAADQAAVDQLIDQLVPQAFDVHRAAAGEMQDRLLALRRAEQPAGAAVVHAATLALGRAAADRAHPGPDAKVGHIRFTRHGLAALHHPSHHLGDHVTRPSHDHAVAHPHALAAQLEHVVQRGVAHRGAAHKHRGQLGHRCQLAGAPHLGVDALQRGDLLLRRVFVRHRPARLAGDKTQALLPGQRIDLVDHAVNVKRQAVALGTHGLMKRHQTLRTQGHLAVSAHRQAHDGQGVQRGAVGGRRAPALHFAQAIGVKAQRALGGNRRVQLPHRTSGGVARVDKSLAGTGALALVQVFKIVAAHINLATHFQHLGAAADQPPRNAPTRPRPPTHGEDVLGHVFAGGPIAPSGGLHQHAVLIAQIDRQAVELQLGAVGHGRCVGRQFQLTPYPGIKGHRAAGLGVGLGADAEHGHRVAHRCKTVQHLAGHALGG